MGIEKEEKEREERQSQKRERDRVREIQKEEKEKEREREKEKHMKLKEKVGGSTGNTALAAQQQLAAETMQQFVATTIVTLRICVRPRFYKPWSGSLPIPKCD